MIDGDHATLSPMSKRSLHVGLNYPGTSAELAGCVNDADDWATLFASLGYDTTVLYEPDHFQILSAIEVGLLGLGWGDRFVFTYSGHGSFVPDLSGDEPDRLDEVLCPSDFRSRVLTDDELSAAFDKARRGVRRTFISDSCHSGTINRFAPFRVQPAAALRTGMARFMPPSEFLHRVDVARFVGGTVITPRSSRVPAALISGCADDEYSYDAWFGGRANGAFTRAAIDVYQSAMRMKDWHKAIRERLPSASFPQSPQLQARTHQRYWRL